VPSTIVIGVISAYLLNLRDFRRRPVAGWAEGSSALLALCNAGVKV